MINNKIKELHQLMACDISGNSGDNALFKRLYAISIIAFMRNLNAELAELSRKQDAALQLESKTIDYASFLNNQYWDDCWLLTRSKSINTHVEDVEINQLTDLFPIYDVNYSFTFDMMQAFKNVIHQLSDEERLSDRVIQYAIDKGYKDLISLLTTIQQKAIKPPSYHYIKFWETVLVPTVNREEVLADYNRWKEDLSDVDFQDLKDKQMQLLVELLSSDFLDYRPTPTQGSVDKCKLKIDNSSLTAGFVLPEKIQERCAKGGYFISWMDKGRIILGLNYEKIGKYVYEHYSEQWAGGKKIIYFDIMLQAIHDDMLEMEPNLSQYIEDNEVKLVQKLIDKNVAILETCKEFLADGISETFFRDYMVMILNDKNIKDEAIEKLKGNSQYTYICAIVAELKNANVIKRSVTNNALGTSLSKKIKKPSQQTLSKNIERVYGENSGLLHDWTGIAVKIIKENKDNPLERIFSGDS